MIQDKRILFAIFCSALLTVGSASLGGYLAGRSLERTFGKENTVEVRGLSEKNIAANIAVLTIDYKENDLNLKNAHSKMQIAQKTIKEFLKLFPLKDKEINPGIMSIEDTPVFNEKNQKIHDVFTVKNQFVLRSENIKVIQEIASKITHLVQKGIFLSTNINYIFTGERATKIKPQMIAEATRNARNAAHQFAQDSDTKVGGIIRAEQGRMTITGRDSSYDHDQNESKSFEKTVRVIATVIFKLEK